MTTLVLVFFIALFSTAEIEGSDLRMILATFQGLGVMTGGNTLQAGKLAELGNNIMSLPATERGRALDQARRLAQSMFEPEIAARRISVRVEERGLIISLSAEMFFAPGSADINFEEANPVLDKVRNLLFAPEVQGRTVRIEGHTDSTGPSALNLRLSQQRADSVRNALIELGISASRLTAVGMGQEFPIASNQTQEGRARNRRVDVIVLNE